MKVGLGLVTVPARREWANEVTKSYDQMFFGLGGHRIKDLTFTIHVDLDGFGVAYGKNVCLRNLLATDCDWLFIAEDDVVVDSPKAITGYIEAANGSGLSHLSFAHHGPRNTGVNFMQAGSVRLWPNSIGAWCLYSRECLEAVGLMDEGFPKNCLEHVEHSVRIRDWELKRNTWPDGLFPDAATSQGWLHEIPGSFENPVDPTASSRLEEGKRYWRENLKTTYPWEGE